MSTNGKHDKIDTDILKTPNREDMVLVRRAIRGGWSVSEQLKRVVMARMADIFKMNDEPELWVKAANTLIAADNADIRVEALHTQQQVDVQHELGPEMLQALVNHAESKRKNQQQVIDADYIRCAVEGENGRRGNGSK